MKLTPAERFAAKVDVCPDGCHLWTGSGGQKGYGNFWTGSRLQVAHRFAYEAAIGPIPEGLELDHLCRNRRCVNPEHLEPVTHRENVLRSPVTLAAINAAKTACPRGHAYDETNTRRHTDRQGITRRFCRTCEQLRERAS